MMGWICTTKEVNEKYIYNIGWETSTWNTRRQQNYYSKMGLKTKVFEYRR
jgi:hypothetical protein